MKEVDNIKRILKETIEAINTNDPSRIKNLSNQTINSASLTSDKDNILVAVIIYSIAKIYEREQYRKLKGWNNFEKIILNALKKSIKDLEKNNIEKWRNDFNIMRKSVNKISGKLSTFIKDVLTKAKINKASKLYEHGLSLGKTSELLGITQYDLQKYSGQKIIEEKPNKRINIKTRIKYLENLMK